MYVLDRACKTIILGALGYWMCSKIGLIDLVRYGIEAVKH